MSTALPLSFWKKAGLTIGWADSCSCTICILHVHVGHAGDKATQGAVAEGIKKTHPKPQLTPQNHAAKLATTIAIHPTAARLPAVQP